MPTEQEYQDHYDEGFEEGRKQLMEYIEQVIDELIKQEANYEGQPASGLAFIYSRSDLKELKEKLIGKVEIAVLTEGKK